MADDVFGAGLSSAGFFSVYRLQKRTGSLADTKLLLTRMTVHADRGGEQANQGSTARQHGVHAMVQSLLGLSQWRSH